MSIWSLSRLHKVHMLVWFVLDLTNSTIFHPIEYFVLFQSHRWFASLAQFLCLNLKGFGKDALCILYFGLNVLLFEPV